MGDPREAGIFDKPAPRLDGQALVRGYFFFPWLLPGLQVVERSGWRLSVAGETDAQYLL